MGKRLAVILGAGASYDCVGEATSFVNWDYRPPLTDQLFEPRSVFSSILEHYPGALALASLLRGASNRGGLEGELRKLASSSQAHIRRQFPHVPMYLRELLGEVGVHFTNAPANYQYMVNRLLSDEFDRVALLTLNYDLLLDRCLEISASCEFRSIEDYVPDGANWMLIKLHGSVNWGYRLVDIDNVGVDLSQVVRLTDRRELDRHVNREIEILDGHHQHNYYPALSVPIDTEYKHICPPEHLAALRAFLSDCPNFLIIGASGKDQDLHDLLKGRLEPSKSKCCVVGANADDARATYFRITGGSTIWAHHPLYGEFSDFVLSGKIDTFLDSLRA